MSEKYPIGEFHFKDEITSDLISAWLAELEDLPRLLQDAVRDLDNEQLDTPYRFGGWTIRQVIHHLADSHMNAYIRCKLALTEENPVIKPYEEGKWAEQPDYKLPIESSLSLLQALHKRWVALLRNLSPVELEKTFIHPDSGVISVGKNIGIYAWHGNHHLAHITSLCKRKNW
ncbi:YfiT family bacillithiol transferase [Metabacillus sediminilitoris]|uniref:Putative metal-dependent hydrolase E6W99_12815 n=1 Tax=Metabacillus sediminilitoris TaxID=2567941 RepID=A0A4S4BXI9_9BACI|nr:bacillithiol transferase BstA [Metabacillus sediminilitoris]QGQ46178.1 bacillithiol transferase BstA [Metabacillus sediminilitoris]THF79231.1 putative metal-dependent hydrolase [Metabacillus sediminilitoris]